MDRRPGSSPFGLLLIGGFKAASSFLLIALGIGLLRSINTNLNDLAHRLVAWIKLDPGNHYIHGAMASISGITPHQLREIGAGTILYGLLYGVEGTGLLLRKTWGEYLTVVLTGLFIPLEIYEIVIGPSAPKVAVFALNVAIVAYLVIQIVKKKREEGASAEPSA